MRINSKILLERLKGRDMKLLSLLLLLENQSFFSKFFTKLFFYFVDPQNYYELLSMELNNLNALFFMKIIVKLTWVLILRRYG